MKRMLYVLLMLSLSFVIFACGAAQSVTIQFETNGGNTLEDLEIDLNSEEFVLPTPVKEGFTFDGWYIDEDLSDPFSLAAILTSTTLTVYAKWIENLESYTITFNSNGGSSVDQITASEGASVSAPPDPTKSGFTFGGWYSDSALTTLYAFTTMPASNLTLYAKWNAVVLQSTITFEVNGGSAVAAITQDVGSSVLAPTSPTKSGFTFGGWYSDSALTTVYTFTTMPATNITLYAKWNAIVPTTITFNTNGGSAVAAITQNPGTLVVAPLAPTKMGNTFAGWYSDSALTTAYTFTTMPASNITLYAKWTVNSYTITFNSNGGSSVTPITQNYGTAVTVPTIPTKTGHTFNGWYSDSALTTAYTFTTMPANNITLYAKWTANSYTLQILDYDGTILHNVTLPYGEAIILTEPIPVREGYTWIGWDLAIPSTMPAQNVTIHAVYEVNTYVITYETNGGTAIPPSYVDYGNTYLVSTTTRPDRIFGGWFLDAELTIPFVALVPMPAYDFTLYAKWIAVYTLTYVVDGEVIEVQNYRENEMIDLIEDPMQLGYEFIGWYEDELLIVPFMHDTIPDHDVTIYAKFEPVLYEVTFDTQDGSALESYEIYYMDYLHEIGIPSREGFYFDGWYYDDDYTMPVDFDHDQMPAMDLILYAKWIEDTGYTPLSYLINQKPEGIYRVKGTVIYQFPNQMDHPGYYLYDGTATIFVLSYSNYSIGDVIEFDTRFSMFEFTPQLVDCSNFMESTDLPDFPAPVSMTYEELANINVYDQSIYGQMIHITGIISQMGPEFMLTGLSMGLDPIVINYKSLFGINPFFDKVGQTVTFQAFIHGYNEMMHQIHIVYDPNVPVIATPKTTSEKLEELRLFAIDAFANMVFYPNQNFIFPPFDPVYGASLEVMTSGYNAMYYDPETGNFLDTDVERMIDVTITATLDIESITIDVVFTLKPLEAMTFDEFKALDEGQYGIVEGIIIMIAPFEIALITDGTSTLPIVRNEMMEIGDMVLVQGYKINMDGLVMMENNPDDILIEVLSYDHPNPIMPIELMMNDFVNIRAFDPIYWLLYYQLIGEIDYNSERDQFQLRYGMDEVTIIPATPESYDLLMNHVGEIVTLRGFGVPYDDKGEGHLALIFTGVDALSFDFSDDDLLDILYQMLDQYLSLQTFYPGQTVDLPTEHPIYPVTVSYLPFGDNASLIDPMTWMISEEIETETWIDLEVTLTLNTTTISFNISLHVKPVMSMTVTEFLMYATFEEPVMVSGIVVFVIPDQRLAFIADDMNVIGAPIGDYVDIGDEVLLFGSRFEDHGFVMVMNEPGMLLSSILSSGNSNPLMVTHMTLSDIAGLNPYDPENQLNYVELSGQLVLNYDYMVYFLTDGIDHVPVWPVSPLAFEILQDYIGMDVIIRGLTMNNNDPEHPMLMLIFMQDPSQIILDMTALDFANQFATNIQTKFIENPLHPDSYFYPPTFFDIFDIEVEYQTTGDNALLYNVETGYIDASITEETLIDVIATILVPFEDPIIVNFQIRVVPLPVLSVTEFINSFNPDQPQLVEGIVIYEQSLSTEMVDMMYIIADDQNILFVELYEYVPIGSRVQLFGFYSMQQGMPMIHNTPDMLLHGVIEYDQNNPLIYTSISNWDFVDLPEFDPSFQFRPYELTGFLTYDSEFGFHLVDQDEIIVPIFFPTDREFDILMAYEGVEVVIKGLCFNHEMYFNHVLLFLGFEDDIRPRYTTEEYVDYLALTLPDAYLSKYFIPGQFYHLPEMDMNYPITFDYVVLDPSLYDLTSETFSPMITIQTDVLVQVTITGGSNTQVIMITLTVIPPIPVNISEFLTGDFDVLYQIQGVITFDTPDEDDGPQMISDSTGSLFIVNKFPLDMGDEVIIVGYRNEFEGLIVMNLYDDAMLIDHLFSGIAFPMLPTPMTIDEFLLIDITDRQTWGMYVELEGYVGVDYFYDGQYFTLYEEFYAGDYLTIHHTFGDDGHSYRELSEYDGLSTIIRGYILPDFIDDYLSPMPMFMYIEYPGSVEFTYETDMERINALIQKGDHYLQGQTYYAFDQLELPDFDFLLSIGMEWSIVSGDPSLYSFETGRFSYVIESTSLTFEVVLTTGDLTVPHQFVIYLEKIDSIPIQDYLNLWYGEYGITEGIIIRAIPDGNYILADQYNMIIMKGFTGLNVSDQIRIYGKHEYIDYQHVIYGYEEFYDLAVLGTGLSMSPFAVPMNIYDITAIDPWMEPPMKYVEVIGRLLYNEGDMSYYLSDGIHQFRVIPSNEAAFNQLFARIDQDVLIRLFTYGKVDTDQGWCWNLLFTGEPGELEAFNIPDFVKSDLLYNLIVESTMHIDLYPNSSINLPGSHPFYGGSITITPLNNDPVKMIVEGHMITILDVAAPCLLDVEIAIDMNGFIDIRNLTLRIHPTTGPVPFVPGEYGSVVNIPDTSAEDMFPGLIITQISMYPDTWDGGSYHLVEMEFPVAADLGAVSYILQYYNPITMVFENYMPEGVPIETDYNNFSIEIFEPMTFRLITTGHPGGEIVSNEVYADLTMIETTFDSWYMNTSATHDMMMAPFVGYEIEIGATVVDMDWTSVIDPNLSYSWYQVNPYTYEMTLIPGETQEFYKTRYEDVGYIIVGRISGDESTVGGYIQISTGTTVKLFNPAYISEIDDTHFVLNLGYDVDVTALETLLIIRDEDYFELTFTVSQLGFGVYDFQVDLMGVESIFLFLEANTWMIGQIETEWHMMMMGFYYEIK